MKQILGEQSQFAAIDFPETSSTARLTAQLEEAVAQLDGAEGIIFLTDLLGGTPFTCPRRWRSQPGREVITGCCIAGVAASMTFRTVYRFFKLRGGLEKSITSRVHLIPFQTSFTYKCRHQYHGGTSGSLLSSSIDQRYTGIERR